MKHRKSGRKLNRNASHRKAMFSNMATSLILHERIQTTTPKAKELRTIVEPLVTLARRGDLHARRQAARIVRDDAALAKLFSELADRFQDRPGGYTRVIKIANRRGDNAPISIIEFVDAAEAAVAAEPLEAPAVSEEGDDSVADDSAEATAP